MGKTPIEVEAPHYTYRKNALVKKCDSGCGVSIPAVQVVRQSRKPFVGNSRYLVLVCLGGERYFAAFFLRAAARARRWSSQSENMVPRHWGVPQ